MAENIIYVMIYGAKHQVIEVIKPTSDKKDDRIFLKEPIKVPGTNYSRKSFSRSECKRAS